jgi:hypothetical protein
MITLSLLLLIYHTALKRSCETLAGQIKVIPSAFGWNTNQPRVGCPKETAPLEITVGINTKPGSVTVAEQR